VFLSNEGWATFIQVGGLVMTAGFVYKHEGLVSERLVHCRSLLYIRCLHVEGGRLASWSP
jgi:hypothetical protein